MTDLQIFKNAPQNASAEELKSYLDGACGSDATLRSRVEALFQAGAKAGGFMEHPAAEVRHTIRLDNLPVLEGPGTQIGRYKLLQEIGAGGFGVVYMAEQKEPVKRRVALKIIKIGMDTKQVVARFEAERQALAMMDHPHIAKVLDGGATDTGRPYFVMELVKGVRITEYCDENQLTTRERLELFIPVCQAIQHAHQKGIIHRDIKPSNVMVTLHDGVPVPKVIDFGIAKATQHELTEKTIFTQYGQFIGTPAYMSPEQAEMSGLDIDTRSDIYSLGVLLYELLVGCTPLDTKELLSGGFDEIRRRIKEEQPAKPSTRRRTLEGAEKTTAARHRKIRPEQLSSELRGDLDGIVLKALEKDRTRRYETVNGLAADLKRHLSNEPVIARPPSAAYRLQKAWRRNKLAFTAGAAVVVALVVGISVSTWQAVRATRAQDNEAAHRTKAEVSEKRAQVSARDATANLYESLLGQGRATRIARQVGYREEVFGLLRKARDLDTPAKQIAALRLEAVASMGDFVGFRPRQIVSAPATNRFEWVLLSPDGRLLALRDASGGIQLRELPSGREVGRWQLEHPVRGFAFSSAGDRLITIQLPRGTEDRAGARVTEFAPNLTGKWQQAGSRPVPGAFGSFSTSNSTFVLAADSWPIRRMNLIDAGSGRTVHSFQRSEGSWSTMAAVTRDGQKLALISNAEPGKPEQIEIWDLPREQLLRRLPPGFGTDPSFAFSGDGRYLFSQAMQGTRIYDTTTFSGVDEFSGLGNSASASSFLPGTTLVAVARPQQRRFVIRDYQKHETVAVFEESTMSTAALFAPGGEFLVTFDDFRVNLYPFAGADECLTLAGHRLSVPGIAFSPDGTRLASVAKDWTVAMWDSNSGQRIWEGDQLLPSAGQAISFSPDGKLLATGDWDTPLVQLWDAESGRQLLLLTNALGGPTWGLQFVPDPQRGLLLIRRGGGALGIWHIGTTRPVLDRESGAVRWLGSRSVSTGGGLVAAPDGKRIAFASPVETTAPWECSTTIQDPLGETPPLTFVPGARRESVQPILFTPDGQFVAVATAQNRVAVFDAATGEPRRTFALAGSSTQGRNFVLSHTGRWLAVNSPSMRGVDIYDFATGELRYALPDREGTVYWLAWHPKEPRLAIARDNGDIAIWDLAKIDRQLTELGLGFAPESAGAPPARNKPETRQP